MWSGKAEKIETRRTRRRAENTEKSGKQKRQRMESQVPQGQNPGNAMGPRKLTLLALYSVFSALLHVLRVNSFDLRSGSRTAPNPCCVAARAAAGYHHGVNTTAESAPERPRDWLRPLRYLWRTPL